MNEAAEAAGLATGEPLADARAKAGVFLQVRAVDAAADDAALRRLALWATRYTPTASAWDEANGADGFFLDIEGAAHLFGGEAALLADLRTRLEQNFGLPARLAVADTPGAAWALARFQAAPACVLAAGREAEALAPLPIEALRLSGKTRTTLRRLGFKTIGALIDKPRAPFAARFPQPNCCDGSTRRSAASTSRSSPSCRRRSITACIICSSRSSARTRSWRGRAG